MASHGHHIPLSLYLQLTAMVSSHEHQIPYIAYIFLGQQLLSSVYGNIMVPPIRQLIEKPEWIIWLIWAIVGQYTDKMTQKFVKN